MGFPLLVQKIRSLSKKFSLAYCLIFPCFNPISDIVLGAYDLDGDIEYEYALCEVSGTMRYKVLLVKKSDIVEKYVSSS